MNTFSSFRFEVHEGPIVHIRYPEAPSEELVPVAFEFFTCVAEHLNRVGYVIDMRGFNPLFGGAKMRSAFVKNYDLNREILERSTVCEAFVQGSAVTKGILTALGWLRPTVYPTKQFGSVTEAHLWAVSLMKREGPDPTSRDVLDALFERLAELDSSRGEPG